MDCEKKLRVLGEESRLKIVGVLLERPLSVNEVADRVGLSQYNASRHLKVLLGAGIVAMRPAGQMRVYSVLPRLRRRAGTAWVLDLGCCVFRFPG